MNQAPKGARAVRLRAAAALSATALSATAGSYTNDFSGGAAGLTIYSIQGPAPEVRAADGNPGGYLKLTDATGSTQSTVIFPDFDGGFPVQAFTFEVDCRIGNGSATPADGFSINFAKTGDPVFLAGSAFNGAAEDGTTTGLSIGFDTYDNANGDVVGFSIKNDGAILQEFPATTLNGAPDDATSLQTGPLPDGAQWRRFKVELKTDGNLDVTWKGVKVVDNLATGWTPSGGRIVFAARTGGAFEAHHFDNIAITTTPAPVAAVTSAKVSDAGYRFEISDFPGSSTVTQATVGALTIDGVTVTPTVSKTGTVTTVTYVPPARVDYRSAHTYTLEFTDQTSLALSGAGTLNAPTMPTGPLLGATVAVNGTWNVREADLPDPAAGDNTFTEIGLAVGRFLALAPVEYNEQSFVNYVNFSDPQESGDRGMFKFDTPFLNNTGDPDNYILQGSNTVVTITGATPAELQRTFQVQSDDGFALRVVGGTFTNKAGGGIIDPADASTLIFPGGTGNSNTRGLVQFPAEGDYTVEFLHFEGAGGAFNEVSWANGDFVNNPDLTTWKLVGGETELPLIGDVIPATGTGAPVGQWNLRVLRDTGGQAASLAGAISYASSDPAPTTGITDAVSPVVNYSDLDGTRGATGYFNNDIALLGNLAGEDDAFITVGRITVPVPAAGYYTLEGLADDGFLVKILTPGGRFVGTTGPGGLDPQDTTTFYNPVFTDVPTLGAAYFDAAGNYDILFLSQEGGGGSSGELSFAPGRHGALGGSSEWQLLGNPAAVPAPTPLFPAVLPGPDGGADVWGIRFIRGAPAQGDSIFNAVASVLATPGNNGVNSDGTTPYLNYSDVDGTPGQENAGLFRGNNVDNAGLYGVADENYLGSTGEDDQIVAVAKARVVIPTTGEWTFGIHSDDGIALRIKGAVWKRVTGDNWIDPAFRDTFFFRFGTGDSNARGVTDLTAGEYDIELVWFEGGVGSNFELYAAQGAFANDGDTANWRLVGGPNEGLALVAAAAPTDPNFLISTVNYNAATSVVTISFPSEAGISYGVEWSTSLTDAPWASAGTVTGTAGTTTTTVNAATLNGGTAPARFFVRVRDLTPQ